MKEINLIIPIINRMKQEVIKENKKEIQTLTKLLEKYSDKKVIFKEFDGDEMFGNETTETDEEDEELNKTYQLYYITPNKDKDWLGGFNDLSHAKNYARKSYINLEKQKARREERKVNRNPEMTNQGIPKGYIIEK
jgi:hypothetical protein